MLFLLFLQIGRNKEVPKIQTIHQSIDRDRPPPYPPFPRTSPLPGALRDPAGAGPGVFRASGHCLAAAPTPPISPGPRGGGRPLPSRCDPLPGSPSRQGSGGDSVRRRGIHHRPRRAQNQGEPGCAPGPSSRKAAGALLLPWVGSRQVCAARSLRDPQRPARGAPARRGVPEHRPPSASWGVNAESL